ncbi:hypothetical protein [Methylobacterium oxalidis]|uniref:Uncharacterized protein n=1 Tax=Methylobacterium oxalidis TaxID=944322 RepID=A0A512J5K2_9HYPH|nr:hypothetical protein [Methylobacterium oxalidis]GEP05261.1 hypothetical protein MOX02_32990 [Methylobacterium oxalidis]GJE29961.1 hypothetical protein LDDCCGHA_0124 [Methylobacterium oxalidis]GLS64695.1 hypothetical protein GCM10007888_30760 [Methylobacterium oxalidis]
MKALIAVAALGLSLVGPALAQPYGGGDYGYRDRGDRYRDRDYGYRDRDDYRDRGRGRDFAFDEREYLRCNPDVRRAVATGRMESGLLHYRVHGRREGRRLSC